MTSPVRINRPHDAPLNGRIGRVGPGGLAVKVVPETLFPKALDEGMRNGLSARLKIRDC